MTSQQRSRCFAFLRRLRHGGRSNMYGAVPYLVRAFAIDRDEAFRLICTFVDEQAAEPTTAPAAVARSAPAKPAKRARKSRQSIEPKPAKPPATTPARRSRVA